MTDLDDLFPPDEQGVENKLDVRDLFTTESLESVDGIESLIEVEKYIEKWPFREKQILYLFVCGYSQAEIGEIVGLSARQVRRLLSKMSA